MSAICSTVATLPVPLKPARGQQRCFGKQRGMKLVGNDFVFFTGFAFLQAFADAQQWNQTDVGDVFHFAALDFIFSPK